MLALDLRERYAQFLSRYGYDRLPESPILNKTQGGTFFTGSAITPYLSYFSTSVKPPSNRLYTQQRVFWTRHADVIGRNPVSTIFQVMMSFFQFRQTRFVESLELVRGFLESLELPHEELYALCGAGDQVMDAAIQVGFAKNNIVQWRKPLRFKVGDLEGTYFRVFLKYKHGVLPIWDVIFMDANDAQFAVDSCLLLERLTFVLQKRQTWYETEVFAPLVRAVEQHGTFDRLGVFRLACATRSIVAAVADGVTPRPKGPGNVIRRLIRTTIEDRRRLRVAAPFHALVPAAIECLRNIGYDFGEKREEIAWALSQEESACDLTLLSHNSFLKKRAALTRQQGRDHVALEELLHWRETYGIPIETAIECLAEHGIGAPALPQPTDNRVFLSDGYSYDCSRRIDDPAQWLRGMESMFK